MDRSSRRKGRNEGATVGLNSSRGTGNPRSGVKLDPHWLRRGFRPNRNFNITCVLRPGKPSLFDFDAKAGSLDAFWSGRVRFRDKSVRAGLKPGRRKKPCRIARDCVEKWQSPILIAASCFG